MTRARARVLRGKCGLCAHSLESGWPVSSSRLEKRGSGFNCAREPLASDNSCRALLTFSRMLRMQTSRYPSPNKIPDAAAAIAPTTGETSKRWSARAAKQSNAVVAAGQMNQSSACTFAHKAIGIHDARTLHSRRVQIAASPDAHAIFSKFLYPCFSPFSPQPHGRLNVSLRTDRWQSRENSSGPPYGTLQCDSPGIWLRRSVSWDSSSAIRTVE
jgi:hypothetical protein